MIRILIFILLLFHSSYAWGQEICDNAIDDDGDGMVDINDDDCICQSLISSSLIPNPSFEERTCCPMENERLDCANDWIQASPPTTDYVSTCGNYLGNTNIPAFAPLPFPDGDGAVGFRNGALYSGSNYKEYVGACLTEKMVAGTTYRIDFFIGFQDNVEGSKKIDITIFGSTKCTDLPFGNDKDAGCPIGHGDFIILDSQPVVGNNAWVSVTFEFIAARDYEVIVLGPSCSPSISFELSPYFYIDRLLLAESNQFGVAFEDVSGNVCNDDLVLSFKTDPTYTYQWYKEGIALIGEIGPELTLGESTHEEGTYSLIVTTPESCFTSQEYFLRIPPYYAQDTVRICEGEGYMVGENVLKEANYYEIELIADDGCDSILQLVLGVAQPSSSQAAFSFCEGDTFIYHDLQLMRGGSFETIIPNETGCDSTITLDLEEILISKTFDLPTDYDIALGEIIDLIPENLDASLVVFEWINASGEIIGNSAELVNYFASESTKLTFSAHDAFGCETSVDIRINIDEEKLKIFVPNIFSPNDDGFNDQLLIFASEAFTEINNFRIFDRWGSQVYHNTQFSFSESGQVGWNGKIGNSVAKQGNYTYIMEVKISNRTLNVSGGFSLIR